MKRFLRTICLTVIVGILSLCFLTVGNVNSVNNVSRATVSDDINYETMNGYVENYTIVIDVKKDGSLDITENYGFMFNKNGFTEVFIQIPVIIQKEREVKGRFTKKEDTYIAKVTNIKTSSEEEDVVYISYENDYIEVSFFQEAGYIKNQVYNFTLSYNANYGDDRYKEFDDFYFDILGAAVAVKNISFEINFPEGIDDTKVSFWRSGRNQYGDFTDYIINVEKTQITGSLTDMQEGDFLTARVIFADGFFDYDQPNFTYIIITAGVVALLFLIMLISKLALKRHPQPVPVVEFTPPDNINPPEAEAALINSFSPTNKGITALVLYWANNGLLSIEEKEEGQIAFKKLKDIEETAPKYEIKMFKEFFGGVDKVNTALLKTSEAYAQSVDNVKSVVSDRTRTKLLDETKNGSKILNTILMAMVMVLVVVSLLFIIPFGYFGYINASFGLNLFTTYIISIIIVGTIISSLGFFILFFTKAISRITKKFIYIALIVFMIIGLATLYMLAGDVMIVVDPFFVFLIINAFALSCFPLVINLSVYKKEGAKFKGRVMGFKDYLVKAEKDRIEMLVAENPNYFYDILPYTYAFDISDKWVEKFKGIAVPAPEWYDSSRMGLFDVIMFNSMLRASIGILRMATMPHSFFNIRKGMSSFGGGVGFTGGGGGGARGFGFR